MANMKKMLFECSFYKFDADFCAALLNNVNLFEDIVCKS